MTQPCTQEDRIMRVERVLWGNSSPGLTQRLAIIETRLAQAVGLRRTLLQALLSVVAGVAVALIGRII